MLRASQGEEKGHGQDVPEPPEVNQVNSQVAQSYPNQPETPRVLSKAVLRTKLCIFSGRQSIQFSYNA